MGPRRGPVFIGLDAMDASVVRDLARAGRMPVLGGMLDHWDVAPIANPIGLVVGGLWPSFWSASGPGHHGSYCFRQVVPDGYETADTLPTDFDTEPFWRALDREGYRCTVFDMPLIRPISLANGRMIGDWGTHDRQLDYAWAPEALRSFVTERGGQHPIDGDRCDTMVVRDGHARLYDALIDGIDRRMRIVRGLLEQPDDLVLAVFSESHCAGHHFWHLHDPAHPKHDARLAAMLDGDPLLRVYERMDAAVGEILDALGDAPAMVLLSHGMGALNSGNHLLDEVLQRIERARYGPPPVAARVRAQVVPYVRAVSRHVRRATGWGRQPVPRRIALLDGSRRWYAVPNNNLYGGVRLNLHGREPFGLVQPGGHADDVTKRLIEDLLELRNDETGRPAIVDVHRTDELFDGPRRASLPDLLVAWDWSAPVRSVSSPVIGSVRGDARQVRTGDHRLPGVVLTRGLDLGEERPIPVEHLSAPLVAAVRRDRHVSPLVARSPAARS